MAKNLPNDQVKWRKRRKQRAALEGPLPFLLRDGQLHDEQVLSFAQWCALSGISKRTGRRLLAAGDGPVVTQLSEKRIGVTVGNNRRWQESRARGGEAA